VFRRPSITIYTTNQSIRYYWPATSVDGGNWWWQVRSTRWRFPFWPSSLCLDPLVPFCSLVFT